MTASIFILPTAGASNYRGKYPNRPRAISNATAGLHIELNDGTRLWTARPVDHFAALPKMTDDLTDIRARAVAMTAAQYDVLREAGRLLGKRADIAGRERRAALEARDRAMVESIKPETISETPANPVKVNLQRQAAAMADIADSENAATVAVKCIDATPTWAAIMPLLRAAVENGTATGKRIAWEELARMAALTDDRNRIAPAIAAALDSDKSPHGRLAAIREIISGESN